MKLMLNAGRGWMSTFAVAQQMGQFALKVLRNQESLPSGDLEAANLFTRARSSAFLIEHAQDVITRQKLQSTSDRQMAQELLDCERTQRAASMAVYETMIRPTRCVEMIEYLFGAVENALNTLL